MAAHLVFDTTMPKIPFPCGFCGLRAHVPFTAATSMVAGCPAGLNKQKHIGTCKLIGAPKYSYKPALKSTKTAPSTNVPIKCPSPVDVYVEDFIS